MKKKTKEKDFESNDSAGEEGSAQKCLTGPAMLAVTLLPLVH